MSVFLLFAVFFLLFGGGIYWLLRYTRHTVGDDSPLNKPVVYRYDAGNFLRWTNTPVVSFLCLILLCVSWVSLSNLPSAMSVRHYLLAVGAVAAIALTGWLSFLLNKFFLLEKKLWRIIRGTSLIADPAAKSLTLLREGDATVLTAANVVQINYHIVEQGRFHYFYFQFVDQRDQSTFFYDYGRGLSFAIGAYFKDVPSKTHLHTFPFTNVSVE